jgi:hypothetical protein
LKQVAQRRSQWAVTVLAAALGVAVGCNNHSHLKRAAVVELIGWADPIQFGMMKVGSLGTAAEACCTEVEGPQDKQKAAYSCCKRVAMEVGARYLTEVVGPGSHHQMDSWDESEKKNYIFLCYSRKVTSQKIR